MSTAAEADAEPLAEIDPRQAWGAVLDRDRRYDGLFVYAVRTTGIYCRPTCPARRPKVRNVEFYGTNRGAEAAGYRACKRCHPRSRTGTVSEYCVRKAVSYLEAHLDAAVTLDDIAAHVGLSPFHLHRQFKEIVGVTPHEYHRAKRLERMKDALAECDTVSRAAFEAGFGSLRAAYETAGRGLGMTPGTYRSGGLGLTIRYAVRRSPFGVLLVAATGAGVCALCLGSEKAAVVSELEREFPNAVLTPDPRGLGRRMEAALERLPETHPGRALPDDRHPAVFKLRVRQALRGCV